MNNPRTTPLKPDQMEIIRRAIMLIETAWMDEYPMPCEVEARNILLKMLPISEWGTKISNEGAGG